jgi:hypothetical protein
LGSIFKVEPLLITKFAFKSHTPCGCLSKIP